MFFLTLPKGERSGKCRINGQAAEFRVTAQAISFRYDGETDWQERRILDQSDGGKLVQYFCDDGPASEGPYTIIHPALEVTSEAALNFEGWMNAVKAGILQHPAMQPGADPVAVPSFDSPILKEMWEAGATVEQVMAWADEQFNVGGW